MVGVLALTALLVWGTQELEASGALAWEGRAVRWVATELPISFSFAMWLEGLGNGFVLWALVLYAAGVAAWAGQPLRALAFLLGYTLVYLPIGVGWWIWGRPRPQIVMDGIASPGGIFHAYPSGHVVQAAFAYGLLFWLWVRASSSAGERFAAAGAYLLLVALVALGRLRIGAHWPSDLVAGAAIGLAWLATMITAVKRGERVTR
jgi:undecaprenyl-diphosphatase